jgi:low affinity Fe/Cu permease
MTNTDTFEPEVVATTTPPERLSLFQRAADRVSYAMGTPLNIGIWIVIVVGWTLLFALHIVNASGTFLPAWFTSTGYNFPLNLVTTVAELYIGFLVGASSNRSERNLEATLARIIGQDAQISSVEAKLSDALKQNMLLTSEIHALTKLIHERVCVGTTGP